MNKKLFYVVLAIAAIATSACKKGDYPANIQGVWVYNDTVNAVTSVISTSSSSAAKGIPATVEYAKAPENIATKILIDYDPEDGTGTFKPEKGTAGLQGSFSALNKESIEVTLLNVKADESSTTLLKKVVYTKKNIPSTPTFF